MGGQFIVPLLGFMTSTFLGTSPIPDLSKANTTRLLGELNVFPLAMMVPNCCAWLFYAAATSNIWVWWSNFPGFILGLWYACVVVRCLDLRYRQLLMMQIIIGGGLVLDFLGLMCFICLQGESGANATKSITGWLAILNLTIFYAAPLSAIAQVVRTRDSSAFVLPLACAAAMNGLMWTTYGLFTSDIFVYGPSTIGLTIGSVQIVCCLIYPRRMASKSLLSESSEKLINRNTSFGSVDTELNFAAEAKFFDVEVADSITPTGSPQRIIGHATEPNDSQCVF